ncbi:glycine cleavage H-protein-domain-containing protein [Gautieria morchelliformis]|nr:glycine cleavage H-protein-domain-containing protein [Gautieria morchelliformis]
MLPALRLATCPAAIRSHVASTRSVLPRKAWLVRSVVSASKKSAKKNFAHSLKLACTAKRYTEEHELISYDDATSVGRLHITEYASKSLGDVVFVELPKKGRDVAKGEQIGAVESVKAASDIYAPVSGAVIEINESLGDRPGLMSSDPESDGWLCDLKLTKPDELESLLTPEAYEKFCEDN